MKSFRFPLQAVLTVRLNQERKALEAFAWAQTEFEKVAARHRRIQSEIEEVFGVLRNVFQRAATSQELQQMQHGLRALQETERRCRVEVQKAQAALDVKSRALLEARQKREVLDKIHGKQLTGYRVHVARAEQKVADEFAILKSVGNMALKWR